MFPKRSGKLARRRDLGGVFLIIALFSSNRNAFSAGISAVRERYLCEGVASLDEY